jgi:hypothetical protein
MTMYTSGPQSGHGPNGPLGPGAPTGPDRPARGRKRWLRYGAVALISLGVGVGIGSSGSSADTGTKASDAKAGPRPTVTVTQTASDSAGKDKKAGPADHFPGEGEYVVGEDIEAGTYRTAGPEGGFGCYWERAKDASGEFGSIIANNNLQGPGRVTLHKGEYFKTNRCQEWKKAG